MCSLVGGTGASGSRGMYLEVNREWERAGIWKEIGKGKGQVYGKKQGEENDRYMEGIVRGQGQLYGRGGGWGRE